MNASIKGCLININKCYRLFTHKGSHLSKTEVRKILEYGLKKGYSTIHEISDTEIEVILNMLEPKENEQNKII